MPGTYIIEVQGRGVASPLDWQHAILGQFDAYTHTGYTVTFIDQHEPRAYSMLIRIDGTYEDEMDGLLEDVIQVTGNFFADDGVHFKLTDPEGRTVNEGSVRCSCGDHAVEEAEEILRQSKNET